MAAKKCPACGKTAEGKFCSWCGASLDERHCTQCGAPSEPGARFCNACGAPLGTGSAGGTSSGAGAKAGKGAPGASPPTRRGRTAASEEDTSTSPVVWGVAGLVMVALILAVALPAVQSAREASETPAAPVAGQGGSTGAVDLASMTPRQAADQLYDRIMRTSSAGDSAGAAFFLPMAVQAYDRARPLDADGLFHLSLLQRMAGDPEAGLATAREGLAVQPNHLLILATAAGAAAEMGDTATAQEYYDQLLASWDDEMGKGLPEYEAHAGMMPEIRQEAESFSGG